MEFETKEFSSQFFRDLQADLAQLKSMQFIPIVYHPVGDGTYRISGAGLNTISDEDEKV